MVALVVKNLSASAGAIRDVGSIPGSGWSSGVGNGHLLQYSCLENSIDRGAWWITVCGVTESRRLVNTHTHTHTQINLERIDIFSNPWPRYASSFIYIFWVFFNLYFSFHHVLCSSFGKESACSAGDLSLIPGLGRSPGEGNGNPLQYPCLEKISCTEEPGRLQSMGSQRVGHGGSTNT